MNEVVSKLAPFGLDEEGLVSLYPEKLLLRKEAFNALEQLRQLARLFGFEIRVESAYRSFDRQISIWNRKAKRELPLLDERGQLITRSIDDPEELVKTILIWSALPGASRHHFGTDIDIVDASSIPEGYEVQLTPEECNGMFKPFHDWLTREIESGNSFGFERVFIPGRGKIQPEPWHLSYLPAARIFQKEFNLQLLKGLYSETDIACKEVLLDQLDDLAKDYIFPYFL
ncbi:MAG: M15 family metallopeptidase [Fibrobacter sp.]|nr:M15 family metallopeptidase [Fibrobacter sp.]